MIASIAIPLMAMRPYLREQALYWPGYRLIERSKVAVGDGAFRDGSAAVETHREIPAGIPPTVKLTSFLAMFCGQLFPILGMYAALGLLTSIVFFAELGFLSGLNILVGILGSGAWAMAARSGWKASAAVLSGDERVAEAALQKSVNWHLATLGTMVAAVVFAMVRDFDGAWLVFSAPFFALVALAFFQQAAFRAHKSKLPSVVGAPLHNEHGFEVSGVRVQDVAEPAVAAADDRDATTIDARDQRQR
ncbi:MAG: hypothetical protein JNK05_18070 [Myxococcales bacterium]|nr:hypothetical protein [Myxococcales bacterium]